ncbi:hypothetical protein, partial [Pseudomonas viridiflava]|uniref:hypothetical protein n=1 Tax=Pseudomonas viridiflava TaxID=33069 RepID=UPI00197E8420
IVVFKDLPRHSSPGGSSTLNRGYSSDNQVAAPTARAPLTTPDKKPRNTLALARMNRQISVVHQLPGCQRSSL